MLTVLEGDCRDKLRELADESVHCCVTSPPYYGLRDYGVGGQIGLEATPEEYIAQMVAVFREVRRVLRSDGTLWLNLGDSYAGSWGNYGGENRGNGHQRDITVGSLPSPAWDGREQERPAASRLQNGLKPKDLCGIPWRVAFALQADGWYLRSEIIWAKPNPMPESVTDRPTKAHEQVFLLAKNARYFYDAEAIKEGATCDRKRGPNNHAASYEARGTGNGHSGLVDYRDSENAARNKRTVWTIATAPYSDAHFATFPPKLVEPCVLAGTSARGCCAACGAPWERVVATERVDGGPKWAPNDGNRAALGDMSESSVFRTGQRAINTTTGWQPTCTHLDADVVPCSVLDPFAGSGTVGKVALELGRRAILIELNPKYCEMIERRNQVTLGLPGLA